jgi:hypothetical protein
MFTHRNVAYLEESTQNSNEDDALCGQPGQLARAKKKKKKKKRKKKGERKKPYQNLNSGRRRTKGRNSSFCFVGNWGSSSPKME